MAWVEITFSVQGDTQVARAFELSERQAKDMSSPLRRIGGSLLETVKRQFDTRGAYGGSRWQPLSAAYAAWKAVHFPDTADLILVRTGLMRETVEDPAAVRVTNTRLVYRPEGPHADIAAFHQAGHVAGADHGPLPQRKIVAVPDPVKRNWERIFLEWIRADVLFTGELGRPV